MIIFSSIIYFLFALITFGIASESLIRNDEFLSATYPLWLFFGVTISFGRIFGWW